MRTFASVVILLCSSAVHAETIKPGLWEINSQTSGAAVSAIASIPEAQRKQAEAMGIKLPPATAEGIATKSQTCITPEQAKQGVPPNVGKDQEQCEQIDIKTNGKTTTWKTICSGKHKATGVGSVTYDSPERFNGEAVIDVADALQGFNKVNNKFTGTFIAAECPPKK